MLTSRELPRADWIALDGFELGKVCHQLPSDAVIVVVERDDVVVACWSVIPVFQVMLEGVEVIGPEQKNPAVIRRLLSGVRSVLADNEVTTVLTGAATDDVRHLLEHAGAKRAEMDLYSWPIMEGATPCLQR